METGLVGRGCAGVTAYGEERGAAGHAVTIVASRAVTLMASGRAGGRKGWC